MQWNLIRIRKEHDLTQKDMAEFLKTSEETYRSKELGRRQFKGDEMFLIANKFDKNLSEIFLPTKYTKSELNKEEVN